MTTPTRDTPRGVLWWMLWDNYTPAEKAAAIDAYRAECRHEAFTEAATLIAADTAHIRYGSATDYANRHSALLLARVADPDVNP